jgi:hypothetical protein
MDDRAILYLAMGCIALQGCSSRPREFAPSLAAPAASPAAFDAAYASCQQRFLAGKLTSNGKTRSATAGAGAGVGTAAVGGGAAAVAGGWGGVAIASATIVLLPFAVVGGAWGMSRRARAKKEQAIKLAMENCLGEAGYRVGSWTRTTGKPAWAAAR